MYYYDNYINVRSRTGGHSLAMYDQFVIVKSGCGVCTRNINCHRNYGPTPSACFTCVKTMRESVRHIASKTGLC